MIRKYVLPVGLALCLAVLSGCGQPSLGDNKENYVVVMRLNTALMAKKPELVEQVWQDIQSKHTAGEIPDAAFNRLQGIVDKSKSGDWPGAQSDCLKFQKGQRPPQGT